MPQSDKTKVIVIVGQTGSGKTALSLKIAQQFQGEVISADSRQVYRGLDIGTEKITEAQMEGIPHHLLSIASPEQVYTAHDFVRDAQSAIDEITRREHVPIITGGTFFYIDTLLGKVSCTPVSPDPKLRAELEAHTESELFAILQEKDPARASSIDKDNKRRLVRALEILATLPAVPPPTTRECPYEALILGIRIDKDVLRKRLRERAQHALSRGLIKETQTLLKQGVTRNRLSEIGLEYKLVLEYLDGTLVEQALLQKLEEKNWQYAKRQMVWLKRDASIQWFESEDTQGVSETVERFLDN
jgi:tRNA dimethylallyltransferase